MVTTRGLTSAQLMHLSAWTRTDHPTSPCAQYMDRIYVKHQNKTQVNQLGLDLWRDVVVRNKRIRERLRSTLLGLVHRERAGEVIDRALMRNITTVRTPSPVSLHVLCGRQQKLLGSSHTNRVSVLLPAHGRIFENQKSVHTLSASMRGFE